MLNLKNLEILITFCAVLLLYNQNFCWAYRGFQVILNSFPHEFNSNLIDVKIDISNDTSNNDPALNIAITALEDIDDILLSYMVSMEIEKPNNYTLMLKHKIHLCKFLQQSIIDHVLSIVYDDILAKGNFINACPLEKGKVYSLQEYHVNEEEFPQYVPEAKFYVDLVFSRGSQIGAEAGNDAEDEMLLKGRLYGKIDKSKGFNYLKSFSMG